MFGPNALPVAVLLTALAWNTTPKGLGNGAPVADSPIQLLRIVLPLVFDSATPGWVWPPITFPSSTLLAAWDWTRMPTPCVPTTAVWVGLRPMMFPCTRFPDAPGSWAMPSEMPPPPLAAMTLPPRGPPIVFPVAPLATSIPRFVFGTGLNPEPSVPIRLPKIVFPVVDAWSSSIPAATLPERTLLGPKSLFFAPAPTRMPSAKLPNTPELVPVGSVPMRLSRITLPL